MSDLENEYQVQIKSSEDEELALPKNVVIIPIMNSPIFPGMIAPIILTEEKFTPELDQSLLKTGYVALNLVKSDLKDDDGQMIPDEMIDLENREIQAADIYKVGVLCKVVKKNKTA